MIPILIDQIAHGRTWSLTLNPTLTECLLSMTTNTDDVTCTRDLVAYEKALRFEWRVKRAGKERAFSFACISRVNPNVNGKLLLQAIRPGMSFHTGGCGKLFQLLPHKISFNRLLKRTLLRQTLNLQLNKLLLTCPFSKQFLGLKGKHFNPKNWHLQTFTYLLPKPMPYIIFRFEGGRRGSHWDICISHFSHFSDTRDDTLIVSFISLLLIHSIPFLGVSWLEAFFSSS